MRLSSQIRQHSQQPKSRLDILLSQDYKESPQGYSPHLSRSNFHKKDRSTPFRYSGPQIPQTKVMNMQNQRYHNLSSFADTRKAQSRDAEELNKDLNINYIKQIEGLTNKRKARYYFKRHKEGLEDNFRIGVLTGKGIEECSEHNDIGKASELSQQIPRNQEVPQDITMQEMHYEMVKTQQRYKNVIKQ